MVIEYLGKNESEKLLNFISKYWSENNIYVRDIDYFKYEFSDNSNFVIHKTDDNIDAMLGFYDYSKKGDIFLCLWKNAKSGMEGLSLLNFLLNEGFKSVSTVGLNKTTASIYKFLGMNVDKLKHFYILNPYLENYKIAKILKKDNEKLKNFFSNKNKQEIIYFKNMQELLSKVDYSKFEIYKPFKSKEYFNKKYFENPYYDYNVISLNKKDVNSVLVYRVFSENNKKCLRIIDFLGDEKDLIFYIEHLKEEIVKKEMEYIDFYEYGINDEVMYKAGFEKKEDNDENIIPNYFEPFEQSNVDLYFASTYSHCRIFKGDGDQDRPNISRR